jgi:NDP-sugar pyrophosphorylase family protein
MQAIILAGGMGTRLGKFVNDKPKPFLKIGDNPFVRRIVDRLVKQGISDIIFCLGYKADKISEYFGDGSNWNINITYIVEDELKGTAGAIRGALSSITGDDVIVLNGDSFCFFNLEMLVNCHKENSALMTLTLVKTDEPDRYGLVDFDENGRIKNFQEKGRAKYGSAYINAGVYVINRSIIMQIDQKRSVSLEKEILPFNLDNKLFAYPLIDNRFVDIGTPESLEYASTFFDSHNK